MSLEVHKIPVISTCHITREVADRLTVAGNGNPWCCCASWDYGYFLHLDELEEAEEPAPQCLIDIRNWLRTQEAAGVLCNSRWLRLDTDGPKLDDLPYYDW